MGQATPFDRRLAEVIEPTVMAMDFELVRVRLQGSDDQRRTLQIMAERGDGTMTVEDCAQLSRAVSAVLDVEDPIDGEYILEVSSPGIDRPLTRLKDFATWAGFEAKLELAVPRDGRRRFKGRLRGLDGDAVLIDAQGADGRQVVTALPFVDLAEARLVITDDLLAAAASPKGDAVAQGQDIDTDSEIVFEDAPDHDAGADEDIDKNTTSTE